MSGMYIKALSAAEIAKRLAAVARRVFPNEPSNLTVQTNFGALALHIPNVQGAALSEHALLKAWVEKYTDAPYLVCVSANLHLQNDGNQKIAYQASDQISGMFTVTFGQVDRLEGALAALRENFDLTPYIDRLAAHLSGADRDAMQLRERAAAELTAAVDRLGRLQADLIAKDAEERRRISTDLETQHQKRTTTLEEKHAALETTLQATHAARAKALDERIAAFDAREAAFETKEARHVRRDLRKEIEKQLAAQATFKLSTETGAKRRIVHYFTWLLMALALSAAVTMLLKVAAADAVEWRPLLQLSAFSATLVTTFIYYLKWTDRWFREHADAELAARRQHTDILRASWVAEWVSELADKHEDAPPELIAAFTRNLYRNAGPSRESEHPIESLTGMIKRITSVTVGKGTLSVQGLAEKASLPSRRRPAKSDAGAAEEDHS